MHSPVSNRRPKQLVAGACCRRTHDAPQGRRSIIACSAEQQAHRAQATLAQAAGAFLLLAAIGIDDVQQGAQAVQTEGKVIDRAAKMDFFS